jgi:hypothetical protein
LSFSFILFVVEVETRSWICYGWLFLTEEGLFDLGRVAFPAKWQTKAFLKYFWNGTLQDIQTV